MTADEKNNDLDATAGLSHHQAKKLLFKLKQDRFTSKEPFMTILGTRVTVMRPLSRDETQDMTSGGKDKKAKRTPTGADDPRNLYLLREGVIEPDTPAAEGLNPRFLASLQRDYETRKHQLRNVNLFVSRTRLSVRNIPRHVDTKQLRALFLDQVRALIKQRPELKDKKSWGKFGPIKNVKVLVDSTGASKGYGFVEFVRHEYALYTLRLLNNNPTTFGPNSRLVVAFAVENVNALQKMERMKLLRKQREEQRKRGGFEDDDDDDSKKQSAVRRLIDKADDAAVSKPSGAPAKAAASINASAKTAVKRAETKKTPRSLNTRKSAARKRVNNERVNRK
jgi:nucleolar protein 4